MVINMIAVISANPVRWKFHKCARHTGQRPMNIENDFLFELAVNSMPATSHSIGKLLISVSQASSVYFVFSLKCPVSMTLMTGRHIGTFLFTRNPSSMINYVECKYRAKYVAGLNYTFVHWFRFFLFPFQLHSAFIGAQKFRSSHFLFDLLLH